jgi:signal transduction histidine kinase
MRVRVAGAVEDRWIWMILLVALVPRLLPLELPASAWLIPATHTLVALIALILSRRSAIRLVAVALILTAAVDTVTQFRLLQIASQFDRHSAAAVEKSASAAERQLQRIESDVSDLASQVSARVATLSGPFDRRELFRLADAFSGSEQNGVRISTANHGLLAWWGENLPEFPGERPAAGIDYRFDVTSLYVISRAELEAHGARWLIEVFERVPNLDPRVMAEPRTWLAGSRFHSGALQAAEGAVRHQVRRSGDLVVMADFLPRSRSDVLTSVERSGNTAAAFILAAGLLLAAALLVRRTGRQWDLLTAIGLVLLARWVLLAIRLPAGWEQISGFEIYGSRLLGPLSRSPLDLFFTMAALLAIVLMAHQADRWRGGRLNSVIRAIFVLLLGWGLIRLIENLVANSRIVPLPEHILPRSAVEGLLLGGLLLAAMSLLVVSRFGVPLRWLPLPLVVISSGALLIGWSSEEPIRSQAWLMLCGAVVLAIIVTHLLRGSPASTILLGAAATLLITPSLLLYSELQHRRFVEQTLAPLIAGEATQLRIMIEDTLSREFQIVPLDPLLPAPFEETNLEDLAYVLWAISSLSALDVPAAIRLERFDGRLISRFGVGLPQIPEAEERSEREVLRIGSLVRELLHHDFELQFGGQTVARGTVHIVEPTDAGSTAFADTYRDFFVLGGEAPLTSPRIPEPIVFDREGSVLGHRTLRLPQSPTAYFRSLQRGDALWLRTQTHDVHLRRGEDAIFAFPIAIITAGQQLRQLGGLAVWGVLLALLYLLLAYSRAIVSFLRSLRGGLRFRARTSIYLTSVVILPLLLFVILVRAYLADRLETEYLQRGQNALDTAQRVIEDYLASSLTDRPEEVLDDEILTWLASVIGHDLHLFRDDQLFASSRRDLFSARIQSIRLRGQVYSPIVLEGAQLIRADYEADGGTRFVEIYSPITLAADRPYILALPFIFQARQIEAQVNDLATTIYLLLFVIALLALTVAYRMARTVTMPVQDLVAGAQAVASGEFALHLRKPSDPDLGLLVTTFSEMAQSIDRQQQALRYERDRLQTLIENINAAVVVLDGTESIVATNRSARSLFSLPEGSSGRFTPPFPEVAGFLDQVRRRDIASTELALAVGEETRTFRVSLVPLPESAERMLIVEDVTEIIRANRLEAWAEMARQVAHEIKNPLTPIQLTAEHLRALADRNDPNLATVLRTGVENILRQVETLRETSREFGDYASARNPHIEAVDLRRMLSDLAAGYVHSEERGISFSASIDPSLSAGFAADERLLVGALTNLLENALQAAGEGGEVELVARQGQGEVVIEVRDSGPGVPPEVLARIFDPYFSTKSSGTGLGLAIARKAVEEHRGTIEGENLHPGFVIRVTLPQREILPEDGSSASGAPLR